MEMPKPTEAHEILKKLVGAWVGEERISPSPWDPKGGTAIGRIQNRLAVDGFVVVEEYEQEREGVVTFRGHGVFSWDSAAHSYSMHWWDSTGSPPDIFRGPFQDGILTLICPMPNGHGRASFDLREDGQYRFRMEFSPDGSQWHLFMEGAYSRTA